MIRWLTRLDLNTLRNMVGEIIINAINENIQSELEVDLAKVLMYKHGYSILEERDIRLAILDSLTESEAKSFARTLNISLTNKSYMSIINEIQKKYYTYTTKKSIILCEYLKLSNHYIKKKIIDDRASSCRVSVEHGEAAKLKSYLHPYQKGVKDQILNRLINNTSDSFMVQMPTGSGKTYTAQEAMVDVLRSPNFNKFVVWIVDKNELAEQAFKSFHQLWKIKGDKEIMIHRLFKKFEPQFSNEKFGVVFVGFEKLDPILNNYNHKYYEEIKYLIQNTELLIVDEAHKSVADTYNGCIEAFKSYNSKIIGLTATPGRNTLDETLELIDLFSGDIIEIVDTKGERLEDPIQYLQRNDYLANISIELFKTDVSVEEKSINSVLDNLSKNSNRNSKIVDLIREANGKKESTLVFACNIDHVIALKILCDKEKIPVEYIIGSVDQAKRLEILTRFKANEFFILINVDILSTGIDVPNVDKLIITKPVGSSILYSQIIGRALRGIKNGGNRKNTIVNLKDNLLNYSDVNSLFGKFELEWQGKIKYSS